MKSSKPYILKEAAFDYSATSGYSVGFYSGRSQKIPNLVVTSIDNRSVKDSQTFVVSSTKPRVVYKNALAIDNETQYDYGDSTAVSTLQDYAALDITDTTIGEMEYYDTLFTVKYVRGRDKLFMLLTGLGITDRNFENTVGQIPELEDGFVSVDGARLFFPEEMAKKRKEGFVGTFQKLDAAFTPHGLGNLINGDVRFGKISSKYGGLYYPKRDNIIINPTAKNDPVLFHTMIHEHGHRYWEKFMSNEAKKVNAQKFSQLKHTEKQEHVNPNLEKIHKVQEDFYSAVEVGTTVHYMGRKKDWKEASPFKVREKFNGKLFLNNNRGRSSMSGGGNAFMNKNWKFENVDNTDLSKMEKVSHAQDTDQWFPTQYSMQENEEWFAELFAFYIMGHLQGEPKAFMANLLTM